MTVRNVGVRQFSQKDGRAHLVLTAETDADPAGKFDLQYMVAPASAVPSERLRDECEADEPIFIVRTRHDMVGAYEYSQQIKNWLEAVIRNHGYDTTIQYDPEAGEYSSVAHQAIPINGQDLKAMKQMYELFEDRS